MRAGERTVCDFLDVYACDICRDFGLPRPQSQHTRDQMPLDLVLTCFVVHASCHISRFGAWPGKAILSRTCAVSGGRLAMLGRFAKRKGIDGKPIRWFSAFDTSAHNIKYRHARMVLCDFVVILQNASPYQNNICFWDSMADIFNKTGQSMAAACHILRDKYMFKAPHIVKHPTLPRHGTLIHLAWLWMGMHDPSLSAGVRTRTGSGLWMGMHDPSLSGGVQIRTVWALDGDG